MPESVTPQTPADAARAAAKNAQPVRIVDLDMPFGSMVSFMVKWALAAIPAVFILAAVIMFAIGFLGAMSGPR